MTELGGRSVWVNPAAAQTLEMIDKTDWYDIIDDRIDELCAHWGLTPTGRLDGGALSVVVAATRDDTPVVVKVPIPGTGTREAAVLEHWADRTHNSRAAVQVLDRDDTALLLEMIDGPGTPTASLSGDLAEEAAQMADIFSTIAATPADTLDTAVPTSVWLDVQTAKAAHRFTASGNAHLIADLNDRARDLAALSVRARGSERLCHGDLWHHNVLRRTDGTWCMIDPAGMAAPVEADIAFWSVCAEWGLRVPERIAAHCAAVGADPAVAATWAAWQCLDRAGVALAYGFDADVRVPQLVAAHDELLADTDPF